MVTALWYSLKSGIVIPSGLVFFFKISLAIRGLFWFHTSFRIVCCGSMETPGVILIGIALNM